MVCTYMHTCRLTPEEHFAYFQLENSLSFVFWLFNFCLFVCCFSLTSLLLQKS